MFKRNPVPLKTLDHCKLPPDGTNEMYGCKCYFEIKIHLNLEISVKYIQFMVARDLLRNSVSIGEWLAATTFVKNCTLKKLFPAINYREKIFFKNNYSTLDHSLLEE